MWYMHGIPPSSAVQSSAVVQTRSRPGRLVLAEMRFAVAVGCHCGSPHRSVRTIEKKQAGLQVAAKLLFNDLVDGRRPGNSILGLAGVLAIQFESILIFVRRYISSAALVFSHPVCLRPFRRCVGTQRPSVPNTSGKREVNCRRTVRPGSRR